MPRIHDMLQDCVIYLYPTVEDADAGERVGGSGFLVTIRLESDPNTAVIWAVTNKHVALVAPVVRLNTRDGSVAIANLRTEKWILHPDGDDLAIHPIPLDPTFHKTSHVPREILLSREVVDKYDIGIGDDVFVVGRFVNHEGHVQNVPSLRFGNIAQMPALIRQDTGFDQESFLVEAKSISGYSGSPVFVHILPMSSRPQKDDPKTLMIMPIPGAGPWLLGIDWGHLHSWEEVCDEDGNRLSRPPYSQAKRQVSSNTGMMCVIPAWKLEEMFRLPEVERLMKKADEAHKARKAKAAGRSDVAEGKNKAKSSENREDANPNHREDFDVLLTKAVTPKK